MSTPLRFKWSVLVPWMALSIVTIVAGSYGAGGVLDNGAEFVEWLSLACALFGIVSFFLSFFQVLFALEHRDRAKRPAHVASHRAGKP